MAFPDYEQTVWDQRSILIMVNSIGPRLNEDKFQEIFEQISGVTEVSAEVSTNNDHLATANQELGNKRTFIIRYVKNYPVENNEWGDFQKHRQVLGIISVGGYTTVQELEEIKRLHHLSKVKFRGRRWCPRGFINYRNQCFTKVNFQSCIFYSFTRPNMLDPY